jgi:protein ImuB
MYACLHGPGNLTGIASEFSPTVEQTAEDTVTFDVSGLDRLFGLPQDVAYAISRRAKETGVSANLALAANADTAIYAARGFQGVSIVPQGDEAKFLGPLPVALLGPTPDLAETLERWGIRRLAELGALPPLGIAERLGAEGLRLRELARGESDRKLLAIEDPLRFEDEIELEYPVELLEPLAFLLARLVNGLATRLATRGLATNELRLRLKLEPVGWHERTLRLPVPSLDTKAFLKLMQLDLAAHPPCAPIVHVWMAVDPVKPQAAQSGLFLPAAPEPVKLELTLARIQSIVGQDRVARPSLLDSHGPGGPVSTVRGIRQAFRYFRPPLGARVTLASAQPSYVAAAQVRGKVLDYAGPWRTSGSWWTVEPWQRDEWDVALSDGALYRLYCSPGGWFLEGSYD